MCMMKMKKFLEVQKKRIFLLYDDYFAHKGKKNAIITFFKLRGKCLFHFNFVMYPIRQKRLVVKKNDDDDDAIPMYHYYNDEAVIVIMI